MSLSQLAFFKCSCLQETCKDFLIPCYIVQVCFEIIDPLTINKVVTNKATYYTRIDALPEWTKPALTDNVPAFTIWIDESQALRKYEFQCARSDEYVPLTGYVMKDVR